MPLFEAIYSKKINNNGDVYYNLRNIDLFKIESIEYVDEKHTKIFMDSGNHFIGQINHLEISAMMFSDIDGYGKLFLFNTN
jgi:hypothetical protein